MTWSNFLGNTVSRPSPTVGPGSHKLNQCLEELKSGNLVSGTSAKSYMDLVPWMEPSENGQARIHEFQVLKFVGRGVDGRGVQMPGHQIAAISSAKNDVASIACRFVCSGEIFARSEIGGENQSP